MEKGQLRFGDITSADVKLWLTGPNDQKYERNPLHLHSLILNKSEYFKAKISEQWSSDKPKEIRVTTSHNFEEYLKCIQLMYVESVHFSDVDECLAILSVAAELLLDHLINKCMQCLQAVRWRPQQETQIGDMLSSLLLKPIPDLAARLEKNNDDYMIFAESIINEMVSIIKVPQCAANRKTAEKYIKDILEGDANRENKEVLERVLLQEFKSSIVSRDFKTMRSLLELFERCQGEMLNTAFNVFFWRKRNYRAVGNGKMVVSRDCRVLFVRKCVSIMTREFPELDNAVVKVIESLPLVDRRRICLEWIELCQEYFAVTKPFTLSKHLLN